MSDISCISAMPKFHTAVCLPWVRFRLDLRGPPQLTPPGNPKQQQY
ncbi:MAG: hypothetical protein FWD52_03995 [Candidatus Bathyarchaeota archaeon]|nr:hypothetical protein [Candidatus Termiticorpusculum sp.]